MSRKLPEANKPGYFGEETDPCRPTEDESTTSEQSSITACSCGGKLFEGILNGRLADQCDKCQTLYYYD